MNISNIAKGQVVKNYKVLCGLLNEPIKNGKSKIAQLREWSRYFKYSKSGNKFIIDEIYDCPIPKPINKHSLYIEQIEKILLRELSKSSNNKIFYAKNHLLKLLGMINEEYASCKLSPPLFFENFKWWEIRHFYSRTNQKLSEILFSALNSMEKRGLIKYSEKIMIEQEAPDGQIHHLVANDAEVNAINSIKANILSEMGCTHIPFAKEKGFYAKLNKRLRSEFGWKSCYKKYEIAPNECYHNSDFAVSDETIKKYRSELNRNIIDAINNQANKLYENNQQNMKDVDGLITEESIKNVKWVYENGYVDAQKELAEFLLLI